MTDDQIAQIVDESVSEVIGENIFLSATQKSEKVKFDDYLTDDEDIASRISEISESDSGTSKKPPIILSKIIEPKGNPKSVKNKISKFSDALNGLSDEVCAAQSEIYDRSLLEINRSVV